MTTLETLRLFLRPMQSADIDSLFHIFADPEVMVFFGVDPFGRTQMEQWVGRNLGHQDKYGYGLFSVILKSNGQLIGDCGLERMEVDGKEIVELGYDFRRDYWNRGYATEATSAVRDFAFRELHLPQLTSLIRVGNIASQRVAEKVGMTRTAEIIRNSHHYWKYSLAISENPRC